MGVRIENAGPEHFAAVHDGLLKGLNPRLSAEQWQRLFDPPWRHGDQAPGLVLLDGDRIVGYLGLLHARLPRPDGSHALLCNATSWVVEPAYGAQAVALLLPVLRLKDVNVTNLTPIPAVHAICSRLGFRELENATTILRPAPLERSPWGRVEALYSPASILNELPDWERQLAADHAPYARHVLIRERGGEHCYAIYTVGRRKRLRSAKVHYVTPGSLGRASLALRRALLRRHGAVLTEFDSRFGPQDLPGAHRVSIQFPRLYRQAGLEPAEVPNAYSELVLLEDVG